LADGRVEVKHVQANEAGGFMVYDPDGHRMFFNTHSAEREPYEAWTNGTLPNRRAARGWNVGATVQQNTSEVPVTLPLGQLVVCLDVKDLDASVSFYRGMGFEIIDDQTPVSVTLFSRPARENRLAFPVRLHQAEAPRYSFGFLCEDVDGICNEIKARGIEIITTSDGPAFVDPDGNCVTLFPALAERK
jgi:catechol 2,3-dioxygenase-like lactoylglutathione lyase family enzyme